MALDLERLAPRADRVADHPEVADHRVVLVDDDPARLQVRVVGRLGDRSGPGRRGCPAVRKISIHSARVLVWKTRCSSSISSKSSSP